MRDFYEDIISTPFYLGNLKPFTSGCKWFELDRMKRFCSRPEQTEDVPPTAPLAIVGRVSTTLNNTGIFGGWSTKAQFSAYRARRTFLLGPPLGGPLRAHWQKAVKNLKELQLQATNNNVRKTRYLFDDENTLAMDAVLRMGSAVFRPILCSHIAILENLVNSIPVSKRDDSEWLDIAQTKAFAPLPVFDVNGLAVPLRKVRSVISGALVKVTFGLRCWRFNQSEPLSFAADVIRIEVIQNRLSAQPLIASHLMNIAHDRKASEGSVSVQNNELSIAKGFTSNNAALDTSGIENPHQVEQRPTEAQNDTHMAANGERQISSIINAGGKDSSQTRQSDVVTSSTTEKANTCEPMPRTNADDTTNPTVINVAGNNLMECHNNSDIATSTTISSDARDTANTASDARDTTNTASDTRDMTNTASDARDTTNTASKTRYTANTASNNRDITNADGSRTSTSHTSRGICSLGKKTSSAALETENVLCPAKRTKTVPTC
ncbi:hypothetical protein GYMLUDRAFT_52639 [Collybiopsis luxurians FD-317 M1]|nr:hypothetical protein GYMLUDRAFT_52639 [Collybiopsis luxurians FD-317 M1]